jgi:hypothetical protein
VPKTTEDAIEEEVRRRYANFLSEAGVNGGRVAQEILYMLPVEFVRMYSELFGMALRVDSGGMSKDEGSVKAKGSVGARDPLNARTIRGAQGNGKRWKNPSTVVKSESALEEKRRLDKRLVYLVSHSIGAARQTEADSTEEKREKRANGDNRRTDRKKVKRCGICTRKGGYGAHYCPYDGSKLLDD